MRDFFEIILNFRSTMCGDGMCKCPDSSHKLGFTVRVPIVPELVLLEYLVDGDDDYDNIITIRAK